MKAIDDALYTTLTSGTALTALLAGTTSVYAHQVPRGASYPAVVFQFYAGGDDNVTERRSRSLLYSVKAISDASLNTAGAVDAQIDTLLHHAALTITGWEPYWCAREQDICYSEVTPEGRNYYHSGGLYRIRIA